MATITGRLTLSGTGTTSDVLSVIKDKALTVTSPTVQVGTVVLTASFATTIAALDGTLNTDDTYLYISNASTGTETIELQTTATAECTGGGCGVILTQSPGLNLKVGEFAFLPLKALSHVQFKGSLATAILEYGYWTRSS